MEKVAPAGKGGIRLYPRKKAWGRGEAPPGERDMRILEIGERSKSLWSNYVVIRAETYGPWTVDTVRKIKPTLCNGLEAGNNHLKQNKLIYDAVKSELTCAGTFGLPRHATSPLSSAVNTLQSGENHAYTL